MENGKVIYNNLSALSDLEKEALDLYEKGPRKLAFKNFFIEHFEEQYDYSISAFKKDLLQKAKGYQKINNEVFPDALDEAFRQSPLYDVELYRENKKMADEYFSHLGKTKEAQNMILDYIANDVDINSDELLKANAKYFETHNVTHGLYAFQHDIYAVKGSTDNPLERIANNFNDIMQNKQMELSLSSDKYMVGPIGVTGKTSPIAYHTDDIRSRLEPSFFEEPKRIYQPNSARGTGTIADIIDSLKQKSTVDLFSRHDELIGKGISVESLWVKEDFYNQNKEFVHKLAKDNSLPLDIIHANERTEKISKDIIERIDILDAQKPDPVVNDIVSTPIIKEENIIENVDNVTKFNKYNVKREALKKLKQKTITTNKSKPIINSSATQEATEKVTKTLSKKLLGGGGKAAIGVAFAGLAIGGIVAANKGSGKEKQPKKQSTTSSISNQEIDNSYTMQMAKDISSYRYGKRMTGFVN